MTTVVRHYAFFRQGTGAYCREWKGPVRAPEFDVRLSAYRQELLDAWATDVSAPLPGEIGLDVTHFGWPVGDFDYCTFDEYDRRLEWGPPRHHIDVTARGTIASNVMSARQIRTLDAPGTVAVIDLTGTVWARHHGHLFGRLVGARLEPSRGMPRHEIAAHAEAFDSPLGTAVMTGIL